MKTGVAVALALVAGAIGIGIGSILFSGQASKGDRPVDGVEAEFEQMKKDVETLRREKREAKEEAEAAEKRLAAREMELQHLRAEVGRTETPDSEPAKEVDGGPVFFGEEYDGILLEVDWNTVGANMSEMIGLIPKALTAIKKKEQLPAETIGRIQQLNAPLVVAALKAHEKLPGSGVNGAFTHPAFMVNAIVSALAASELPLDETQVKKLESVGRRYVDLEAKRLGKYDENTYELQKLADEADLKDLFFEEAFRVLTPEQETLLRPEVTRDRVRADLFSTGLLYVMRVDFFGFEKPADIQAKVLTRAGLQFSLTDEERERAKKIIEDWTRYLPSELLEWEPNALDREGLVDCDLVKEWVKQTLLVTKALADGLSFEGARLARARSLPGVLFAMPSSKSTD